MRFGRSSIALRVAPWLPGARFHDLHVDLGEQALVPVDRNRGLGVHVVVAVTVVKITKGC